MHLGPMRLDVLHERSRTVVPFAWEPSRMRVTHPVAHPHDPAPSSSNKRMRRAARRPPCGESEYGGCPDRAAADALVVFAFLGAVSTSWPACVDRGIRTPASTSDAQQVSWARRASMPRKKTLSQRVHPRKRITSLRPVRTTCAGTWIRALRKLRNSIRKSARFSP